MLPLGAGGEGLTAFLSGKLGFYFDVCKNCGVQQLMRDGGGHSEGMPGSVGSQPAESQTPSVMRCVCCSQGSW